MKIPWTPVQASLDRMKSGLGRNLGLVAALLILAMISVASVTVWNLREAALARTREALATRGASIEEQTARAIQAVDLVLQNLQQKVTALAGNADLRDAAYLHSEVFHLNMLSGLRNLPQIAAASLFDSAGQLIAFSRAWPAPPITVADREFFLHPRDTGDDATFVSVPVRDRASGQWSFFLSRRINGPGHQFLGVVVCTIPLSYFQDFYQSVTGTTARTITLLRRDGILMARHPSLESRIGTPYRTDPAWFALVKHGGGEFTLPADEDLPERLVSTHPLQLYPLVVDMVLAKSAALASWRLVAGFITIATLVASAGCALLFCLLGAQFRGMERQQADLLATTEALTRSQLQSAAAARDLETTLASMDEGVMMVDSRDRVVVCNRRAINMLSLSPELMATQPTFAEVLRYQYEHDDFTPKAPTLEGFIEFVTHANFYRVYERIRADGQVLEIRSTPLEGGGMVRVYIDITERRAAEAMRAARDEADRASAAKSEFLATMSHEIRSPMSGLLGVLELLRGTELDAEQSRMAGMVHDSATMLLAVLNDILDFSKIEAGAMMITPEPTDLRTLMSGLLQPHLRPASQRGIDMKLAIEDTIPDRILVDSLRLRQILGNLLSNALKFTAAGTIAVRTTRAADGLRITVRDSGIGMGPEVLARLFNPFQQADGSTSRRFGGTGLGLSISRRLARLLGGDLTVTSRPGEGSEFLLTLPLQPAEASPAIETQTPPIPPPLLGGFRVLVVDDDQTIRWLSQRQLEKLGLRADVAEDGEAGLEKLLSQRYDLLLTDCHMPRMDGVALTRAVRASTAQSLRTMPIIGLTADVTETQRQQCTDSGMDELAIKPLKLETLGRLMARHLPLTAIPPPEAPSELRPVAFDGQIFLAVFPPGAAEGVAWLTDYLAAARREVDTLDTLLNTDAPRLQIKTVSHRLAGTSFSAGAMLLGEAARALERAAAEPNIPLAPLHAALLAQFNTAEAAIATFIATMPAEASA
jgi:signal transduction histidine kinase/DNA-binding response OmpR family regulator